MTPDDARRLTDAELAKLERRVARVYRQARDDLQRTVDDYFDSFQERDAEMKALIGTVRNGRTWTESDYKQWRLNQIARGKRFEALRDKMAERYANANETAMSYVNDATPGIYSLNRNRSAYVIDKATGGALTLGPDGETLNADFILYDEQTVRRLIVEEPDVMPYYPPERAVNRGIDLAYGKSQITKNVTSGILQGLSVKRMADALQERIQTMERNSAIRAARTAVTAAQNAGRMDSYRAAQNMGIKLKKRWLSTLDGRTRHSHRILDGETRETDEAFSNGCMYPGDPRGAPHETYNCRCTLIASLPDFNLSAGQRRAKGATADAEDKSPVVIADMTYSEWAGRVKKALANSVKSGIMQNMNGTGQDISEQAKRLVPHRQVYGASAVRVDLDYIESNEYRMKFHGITGKSVVDDKIAEQCRAILKARDGTYKETLVVLDADTGGIIASIENSPGINAVEYNDRAEEQIENAKKQGRKLLAIHNHPEGYPPTADDCASARHRGYSLGVVCGHNGAVYTYKKATHNLTTEQCDNVHEYIGEKIWALVEPKQQISQWIEIMNHYGCPVEEWE